MGSTVVIANAADNSKPLTDFANVLDVTADPKKLFMGHIAQMSIITFQI